MNRDQIYVHIEERVERTGVTTVANVAIVRMRDDVKVLNGRRCTLLSDRRSRG